MTRSAKDIRVHPISAQDARRIVKAHHYSGTTTSNSQLHLGVFLDGRCGGAMQFGPSLDKRKLQGLVSGTLWHEFIELNRMAFADWLPRNSESRALGYAFRWMRKQYPHLKWCVSFADATQCGDGTIYRASGFVLTGIRKNNTIWQAPSGEKFTDIALKIGGSAKAADARQIVARQTVSKGKHITDDGAASMKKYADAGWKPLPGFQLRYIFFLDPAQRTNLTVPVLPFDEIEKQGAGMYQGKARARSIGGDATGDQPGEGGSIPTRALQPAHTDNIEGAE